MYFVASFIWHFHHYPSVVAASLLVFVVWTSFFFFRTGGFIFAATRVIGGRGCRINMSPGHIMGGAGPLPGRWAGRRLTANRRRTALSWTAELAYGPRNVDEGWKGIQKVALPRGAVWTFRLGHTLSTAGVLPRRLGVKFARLFRSHFTFPAPVTNRQINFVNHLH